MAGVQYQTPAEWLVQHPSYAALDEYIRWDEDRADLEWSEVEKLGLLDHLNRVYTNNGTGASVFERILDLLYHVNGNYVRFSWRLLNKDLGTSVTKIWGSRLSVCVDAVYAVLPDNLRVQTRKLDRFLAGLHASIDEVQSLADLNLSQSLPPWRLGPHAVKELIFKQDPAPMSVRPDSLKITEYYKFREEVARQLDVPHEDLGNLPTTQPPTSSEMPIEEKWAAKKRQYWCSIWAVDEEKLAARWQAILMLFENLPQLQAFQWQSSVPLAEPIFGILAEHCPQIKYINIKCTGVPVGELKILSTSTSFAARDAPTLIQNARERFYNVALNRNCKISVTLSSTDARNFAAALAWLSTWTDSIESLTVEQSDIPGEFATVPQEPQDNVPEPSSRPFLNVRELRLFGVGSASRYIVSTINIAKLLSLDVTQCDHLQPVFDNVAQNASILRKFVYTAGSALHAVVKPAGRGTTEPPAATTYWQRHLRNSQCAVEFLRKTSAHIQDVTIRGWFTGRSEDESGNLDKSLEAIPTSDLMLSLSRHRNSLQRLDILHSDLDLTIDELGNLGARMPNLTYLGISSTRFAGEAGITIPAGAENTVAHADTAGEKQSWWELATVLRRYSRPHRPFALVIKLKGERSQSGRHEFEPIRNGSTVYGDQFFRALSGASLALKEGVPIVLLSLLVDKPRGSDDLACHIYGLPPSPARDEDIDESRGQFLELHSSDVIICLDALDETEKWADLLGIQRPAAILSVYIRSEAREVEPRPANYNSRAGASLGPPGGSVFRRKKSLSDPLGHLLPSDQPLPLPAGSKRAPDSLKGFEEVNANHYGLADGAFATKESFALLWGYGKPLRRRLTQVGQFASRAPNVRPTWSGHESIDDGHGKIFLVGFDGRCLRERIRFHPPVAE
ncbi:MAG: hypothetical protein M1818_005687 [Claussenomyces sp. TS43310]|nr:MAG: hypothetical protein M1818_005687 [Claussenomyces sp. TS43310]